MAVLARLTKARGRLLSGYPNTSFHSMRLNRPEHKARVRGYHSVIFLRPGARCFCFVIRHERIHVKNVSDNLRKFERMQIWLPWRRVLISIHVKSIRKD